MRLRLGFWVFLVWAGLAGAARLPQTLAAELNLADFYRNKTVSIVVGYGAGGGYDRAARLLARHLGNHIPGRPRLVVQNMPGAATLVAANYVNNIASRDGTVIGMYAAATPLAPLLRVPGAKFDARKFNWLGSMASSGTQIVFVRSTAPATTFEQAKQVVSLIGATGPDSTSSYPTMLNELLGTKFKIISGYAGGSSELNLAIARGEIDGRASWDWQGVKHEKPDWVKDKFITVVLQLSLKPDPELPGIPLAIDHAKTEEDRNIMELVFGAAQFSRSFSMAHGIPEDRLAALRTAFAETMTDPEFIKDAAVTLDVPIDYASPEKIAAFMDKVYAFPPAVIARAGEFVRQ